MGLALGFLWGCVSSDPHAKYFKNVESKANVYVGASSVGIEKIAVMPFKAETELIGSSVGDAFVTELMRMGRYELVERGQMSKVLSESELSLAGLSEAKAAEVAKMLGADGVVIGTVDEYTTVAEGGHTYPAVGISARLIDCGTGKVLWSVDLARRSENKKATVAEHGRIILHEMAAGVYREVSKLPRTYRGAGRPAARAPAAAAGPAPSAPTPAAPAPAAPAPVAPVALPTPQTPALTLGDMGLREVAVKWAQADANVRKIQIERSNTATDTFVVVTAAKAQDGQYVDRGSKDAPLKDGTTYYYRIKALGDRDVPGALSPVKESMTALPPDPPQTVRAGALEPRAVTIAWTPSPSEGAVRYVVERAAQDAPAKFVRCGEATTNNFKDGGGAASPLKDSTTYLYRVATINRVGSQGAFSAPVTAVTLPPPPVVEGLKAASGLFRKVALEWVASQDPAVTQYDLYRAEKAGGQPMKVASVQGRTTVRYVDSGTAAVPLGDGVRASYTVRAVNSVGSVGPASAAAEAETKRPPETLTDLAVSTNQPGRIELTWAAPMEPDIRWFKVEGADLASGPFAALARGGSSNQCRHVESALLAGRQRHYRVRSVDADGLESPWSQVAGGTAKPLPPAPAKLDLEYFSGGVNLTWPEVTCAVKYRVGLKDGSDWKPLGETESNRFSVAFGRLEDNTILGVAAVEGDGLESGTRVTATAMDPPPPVPSGVTAASDGLRAVPVKWTPPQDNARTYRIERGEAAGGPFQKVADGDPKDGAFQDLGGTSPMLADSTDYFYRIIALNKAGRPSEPSEVARAKTAAPPVPPPEVTAKAPDSRALECAWQASPAPAVVAYIVERALKEGTPEFKEVGRVTGTSFREGGTPSSPLRDSTAYLYRVASSNRVGSVGDFSAPVEVTTLPRPAVVADFAAKSAEVRCVPLTWKESPERDVVRYDIFRSDAKDGEFKKVASVQGRLTTRHLDGDADPGKLLDATAYFYRIRAINAVTSESEDSPVISATTRDPPPVVEGVAAKSAIPREVPVAWTVSPDEKVIGYIVQRSSAGDTNGFRELATVKGRDTASYNDRGAARRDEGLGSLHDGSTHEYRVVAFNTANAKSEPSAAVSATTKPAPATPVELETTTNLPKSVRVSWAANPEKDIASYVVESAEEPKGRFREVGKVAATAEARLSCVDDGEPDGVPRWYRVKAVDRDTLESKWSEVIQGATKRLPDAPTALQAAWDRNDLTLTWTPSPQPDVANYKVWEKGFFGSKLRATVPEPTCHLPGQEAGNRMTLTVSAVDKDGLESKRSVEKEVTCPPASPASR